MIFVLISYYSLAIILCVCNGERRILGGKDVTVNHTYMVYLRRAEKEAKNYSAWLCGGALVGPRVILTSAACVKDVQYIYVIAGYHKYVSDIVKKNECITHTMKKVVHICVPKAYNLQYEEYTKWAALDIAVVKVNKRIIGDSNYDEFCDYAPTTIDINYDQEELQATGRDVLIMGWGHNGVWRHGNDTIDYNQENLKYGATRIYDKSQCAKDYEHFNMGASIKRYMICTLHPESFNDQGERNVTKSSMNIYKEDGCSDEDKVIIEEETENKKTKNKKRRISTRTSVGICQNDHGGPLIAWQRSRQIVIGVASLFKVKNDQCAGPFLYTSTYCTSNFLKCVVDEFSKRGRRSIHDCYRPDYCFLPPQEKGFDIIERHITWRTSSDESIENMDYTDMLTTETPLSNIASEERIDENTQHAKMITPEVRLYHNEPNEGSAEYETFRVRPQRPLRDIMYGEK